MALLTSDEVRGTGPRGGLRVDWPFCVVVVLLLSFMLMRLRKLALDFRSAYLDGIDGSFDFTS